MTQHATPEPRWQPSRPPGRIGTNFRLPLAIICHLSGGCNRFVTPHHAHPGDPTYCLRCGRKRGTYGWTP